MPSCQIFVLLATCLRRCSASTPACVSWHPTRYTNDRRCRISGRRLAIGSEGIGNVQAGVNTGSSTDRSRLLQEFNFETVACDRPPWAGADKQRVGEDQPRRPA